MLHDFLTEHRDEIVHRCKPQMGARMTFGVPRLLDQLVETLRLELISNPEIGASAAPARQGAAGGRDSPCRRSCTTMATFARPSPSWPWSWRRRSRTSEFRTLNRCLDDAIADAVTEYGRQHQQIAEAEGTQRFNERLGMFVHDLRNQLTKALLAFNVLKTGTVGLGGSTAAALGRSLMGLRDLIDRSLADVRLTAGIQHQERVAIAEIIEDVKVWATMEANVRGIQLSIGSVETSVVVDADREIIISVLTNLLDNAFKFTTPKGRVSLCVRVSPERVMIDVADECGGLPPGAAEELFRPFEQRSGDRSGVGLGLAISRRGAEANAGKLDVHDLPGVGCVFTPGASALRLNPHAIVGAIAPPRRLASNAAASASSNRRLSSRSLAATLADTPMLTEKLNPARRHCRTLASVLSAKFIPSSSVACGRRTTNSSPP